MTARPVIGMAGLGRMGLPIAVHLVKAGYVVLGSVRSSADAFQAIGGQPVESPAALARASDVIITCLPDAASLERFIEGPEGLAAGIRPGVVAIELGSHPLAVKESVRVTLAKVGAEFLDGEISGTPRMVEAQAAPIYVAGDRVAADTMIAVLASASPACHYLGAFGAATTVKLVTNMLVTVHIAAAGEAVALARRLDLDPMVVVDAISGGGGTSAQFRMRAPAMARRESPSPSGTMAQLAVYLPRIQELARDLDVATPVFAAAAALIDHGVSIGFADHDIAAAADVVERFAGSDIKQGEGNGGHL